MQVQTVSVHMRTQRYIDNALQDLCISPEVVVFKFGLLD